MGKSTISNAFYQEAKENFCAAGIVFTCLKSASREQKDGGGSGRQQRGSSLFVLLQMAVEKLCKASYARQTGDKKMPPYDHDLNLLMTIAMRNPSLKDFFEKSNPIAYNFLMNELNPLQPSNAGRNRENLEYPWIAKGNKVKYPSRDLNLIQKCLHDPRNRNLELIMGKLKDFFLSFNKMMHAD